MNSSLVTKHIGVHLGERSILSWTNCCSVADSCLTLCDPMDFHMPDFPVLYCVPEFAQTHVHWVSDAIQSFHPLSSPSPPALNLSQYQGLFQWVSSLHQVAKVLEPYLQFSNEYSGLISFKVDWFWSPWCPRDSQESSTAPQFKNISSSALCLLYCLSSSYMFTWLLERA